MERIAIISDIHGNIPALEATLQDIKNRQITRVFCLGDLVGKGPHSALAVDICREVCERTVMGNWDAHICSGNDSRMVTWHSAQLGPERLAFLAALPPTIEFLMSGKRVRLFHASQVSIFHRVQMYDSFENHQAMFTNTEFTGYSAEPDIVGYGDIHVVFMTSYAHHTLFNVGSVGNPLDLTQAAYAIIEGEYGSNAAMPLGIQLVRVPYDIERAVREAEASGMPELEPYIVELRTALYRGLQKAAE